MANVPIVTEVTYAQLLDLISTNGLNEGLQYSITDKGFLLLATDNNTLKAVDGTLKILNGFSLDTSITCNNLLIDCGIITDDIETVPLSIAVPNNYYPSAAYVKPGVENYITNIMFTDSDSGEISLSRPATYDGYVSIIPLTAGQYTINSNIFMTAVGNAAPGFNLIIKMDYEVF